MEIIIILAVIIVIIGISYYRTNNINFTAGSGMFKNSKYNLEDEKKEDICDYEHIDEDHLLK